MTALSHNLFVISSVAIYTKFRSSSSDRNWPDLLIFGFLHSSLFTLKLSSIIWAPFHSKPLNQGWGGGFVITLTLRTVEPLFSKMRMGTKHIAHYLQFVKIIRSDPFVIILQPSRIANCCQLTLKDFSSKNKFPRSS